MSNLPKGDFNMPPGVSVNSIPGNRHDDFELEDISFEDCSPELSPEFYGMSQQRWDEIMRNFDAKLTKEEMERGWHFCFEWDGLLCNANAKECTECGCTCLK